ncbi:MAG: hypothetical protein DCF22_20855 [Leptolyngbya sp.]|nr:MAG: hypothetical protein DCF22_20855 [Leptolyngbya sp.]
MTQLVPVQLDDGMMLYIEAQDNTDSPIISPETELEQRRTGQKGLPTFNAPRINPAQSMQLMQNTIRTYAYYCMNAFKNSGVANIDEVTLEFGVNLSADAGVPYIASGKAQSSLKITVKCTYPKSEMASTNGLVVGQEGIQN